MLDLNQFKQLMRVLEVSREELHKTYMAYDNMFEDFQGVPKNLARVEDALVDTIDALMGGRDWISWYCYDCSMGEIPMECSIDGKLFIVDSIEALYNVIKEDNACNKA